MSFFTICDGYDCSGNEGTNAMYHIDNDVEKILLNAGYGNSDRIDDLCDYCIKDIANNDDVHNILGITAYDEIVTIEDNPDAVQLKDCDFK